MARTPRHLLLQDNCLFHITWQCHNKDFLLESPWAKQFYYNLLLRFQKRYKVTFFSYCFMSNHPHLSGYCEDQTLLSDFFRVVNSLFAKAYNTKHKRRGQVVMDRYKSPQIHTDEDLLNVMFYIDLNPNRAFIVEHPSEFYWSSFAYYAYGKADPLITPPEAYLNLGSTPQERQEVYLEKVNEVIKEDCMRGRPYSSVPFIGNPLWVLEKTRELDEYKRKQRKEYRERFKKKFSQGPPAAFGKKTK